MTAAGWSRGTTDRWAALRAVLAPIGSPGALSDRVWLIFVPLGLAAQALSESTTFGGPVGAWALAGAVGMVALALVFRVARRLLRGVPEPGPARILVVFALAGLARTMTVAVCAVALDLRDGLDLQYRLVSPVFNVAMLGVIASAVCRHDAHRAVVEDLERTRDRLVGLEQTMDAQLARTEAELAGAVRATVSPALAALDAALRDVAAGSTAGPVLASLERLVATEIRPLSHRLAEEEPAQAALIGADARAVTARVPLPGRLRLGEGIRPLFVAAILLATAIPTAVRDLPPVGILPYLLVTAIYLLLAFELVRRLAGRIELPTPAAVAVVVAVHAIVGWLVVPVVRAVGLVTPVGLTGVAAVTAALVGAMTVGTVLVDARRAATEAEREALNVRLAASVTRLERRRHLARRRLAYVLHGALQGALHVAAMRLTAAKTPDAAVVDAVRADIAAAYAQIDGPRDPGDGLRTTRVLDEMAVLWQDDGQLRTELGPGVETALAGDRDADDALGEVLREAVNNAIRHGRATTVEVRLAVAGSGADDPARAVTITVRDDGTGGMNGERTGLGTRLYDELCRDWSLDRDADGTTFRGSVGLA